jgi:molecular chaperone HscB
MTLEQTVRCWRCGHQHQATLFCPSCETIQPLSPRADYFTVLGIARTPGVDEAELARRYYELSRRLHPDLYQTGTPREKEMSLQNTAMLNRAYRTLRDTVHRGQYWLELQGERLGKDNNRVPTQLAALVFSIQEKLEEIREARAAGEATAVQTELAEIRADLEARLSQLRDALEKNLVSWDDKKDREVSLSSLKTTLSEIAYLRTLLRDVEKESGS